jgi:hypothetical protein
LERARRAVRATLGAEIEGDLERLLVSGALITRDGDHYRVEQGGEEWEELEALARHRAGLCDCGNPLSPRGSLHRCRACGREFHLA